MCPKSDFAVRTLKQGQICPIELFFVLNSCRALRMSATFSHTVPTVIWVFSEASLYMQNSNRLTPDWRGFKTAFNFLSKTKNTDNFSGIQPRAPCQLDLHQPLSCIPALLLFGGGGGGGGKECCDAFQAEDSITQSGFESEILLFYPLSKLAGSPSCATVKDFSFLRLIEEDRIFLPVLLWCLLSSV